MRLKTILLSLLIVLIVAVLVPTVALAEKVTIEYFVLANNEELAAVKRVVSAFEKDYPTFMLTLTGFPLTAIMTNSECEWRAGIFPI